MAAAKDLTGQRFGRLTVLRLHPEPYWSPGGKPTRRWVCRCDCGKELIVLTNALTGKNGTRSCGCARLEKAARPKDDLTGRRFGRWTVLQRAPLQKKGVNGERNGWLCRCDCGTNRVVLARSLIGGKSRSCGCDTAEKAERRLEVDNVLQRYDGTVISAIQPGRTANKNSKSGHIGVYWSESRGMWVAALTVRRKQYREYCSTMEAAVKARKKLEEEYFAPLIEKWRGKNEVV